MFIFDQCAASVRLPHLQNVQVSPVLLLHASGSTLRPKLRVSTGWRVWVRPVKSSQKKRVVQSVSVGQRKMADNEVSSSTSLFSEGVHHYQAEPDAELLPPDQPKQDLFSMDDIVDLVGGGQDALERHMAEDTDQHTFLPDPEPPQEEQDQPSPVSSSSSRSGSQHSLVEPDRAEDDPQVGPDSDALPAAQAQQAAPSPAEEAQLPADTQASPAPASYVPPPSSKAQPQPLMQFPTELGQKGDAPAPISPLSPLHSPDSLEELSLSESPNQPSLLGPTGPLSPFSTEAPAGRSKEISWGEEEKDFGHSQNKDDQLAAPYLSLGKDPGPHNLCEDSGVSFSPEEKLISSDRSLTDPSPLTTSVVVESHIASFDPTEHWDSPFLASQDNSKVSMDTVSKNADTFGSARYEPDLHGNQSDDDDDDDLMYEVKKKNNPFEGFSPLADSGSYKLEESKSDQRATTVSEHPTPDIVQYRQAEELQDNPPSFLDESKIFEGGMKLTDSLMQPISQFSSGVLEEDEDEEEESRLPPSLPDILKSSPLNPDKMDSGSSEGSPEEQSPILERRMMESPNPPINLSANNPFALDAKVSLLKEMADEMEVKVSDKPKDEDVKSFGAFDLVKEAGETSPSHVKEEQPVKIEQKDWFSSHVSPKVNEKFEPLNFESKKSPAEDSDSESPTADSLSPVLEAMAKNPASFQVEKSNIKMELEDPELAEEVSEHEVSSEEFEFIERPPKGVIDEFLEALDTSKFASSKAPEIPMDEDLSFKHKEVSSFSVSAPTKIIQPAGKAEEDESQSSYRLLSQSPQKSKAELEKVTPQEPPSQTPLVYSTFSKPEEVAKKSAEGGKQFKMPNLNLTAVVDLLYWRDVKTTGVVFGAALLLLLSLTVCSIVSVCSYIGLALLSVTICFRIYKGILQAIQKSDEGHPFKQYLGQEVALSQDVVHKYSDLVLERLNKSICDLRRLFLVDDLVDSIKFALFMWILTYVGAFFNGLTLVILGVVAAFSCPIVYEKHQAQIDHYVALVNKQVKDVVEKIQAKVPGMKRKAE
ncbi:reticulon-4a isoform X2 [Entelurus aequoreus]|uniref:reticulon-4a isoform X2 n=1 Tax=Entelurus aequoreus TaxID=161455 RepID=UPI002B1D0686|nr:reticulon-4a isoform X2 [Entelurus aequoreus]